MLTVADITGAVTIRALVDLALEDGRYICAGELAQVSPEEAQRHAQRAAATIELAVEHKPRSCSARRDEIWKAGVK